LIDFISITNMIYVVRKWLVHSGSS